MENKKPNKKNNLYLVILSIIILVCIAVIAAITIANTSKDEEEKDLAYTELIKLMEDKSIEKIEMTVGSTSLKVKFKDQEENKKAIVPNTQAFIELIQEKVKEGNEIELIQNKQNFLVTISQNIFSILPTLIMVALVVSLGRNTVTR